MKVEKTAEVKKKQFYTRVKQELKKAFPNDKFGNIQDSMGFGQLKYRTKNVLLRRWQDVCRYYSGHIDFKGNEVSPCVHSYVEKYSPYIKKISPEFKIDLLYEDFDGYEKSKDRDWFLYFIGGILIVIISIVAIPMWHAIQCIV